jgi:hypothetical protein
VRAAGAAGAASRQSPAALARISGSLCHRIPTCRHGARTPLGKKYWPELGPEWNVCGKAYDAVPINVTTVDGKSRPLNPDDEKQVGASLSRRQPAASQRRA